MYIYVFMSSINVWYTCCRGESLSKFCLHPIPSTVCRHYQDCMPAGSVPCERVKCCHWLFGFWGIRTHHCPIWLCIHLRCVHRSDYWHCFHRSGCQHPIWILHQCFLNILNLTLIFLLLLLYIYFSVFPPFSYVTNVFSIIIYLV